MSSFFAIQPRPIEVVSSFIITSFRKKKRQIQFEKANFSFNSLGKMKKPIQVMLTSVEGEEHLEFLPCLPWDAGKPKCNFIVLNKSLSLIFQKYAMPLHKWYEMEVCTNELIIGMKEIRVYYMLQIVSNKSEEVDFKASQFVSKPLGLSSNHPNVRDIENELINSLEEFREVSRQESLQNMHHIYPKTLVLNINYPILPHFNFGIIFNQEVKEAIEAAGFGPEQGVDFVEVDYEIVIPENNLNI